MYSLRLPPELVHRLYDLRERHGRGPIRRQVVVAIERYLADTESQLQPPTEPYASSTAMAPPSTQSL